MSRASSHSLRETVVPLSLLAGDTLVTFGGLALGWWLRYASPLARLGVPVPGATFARYLPLLLVGVALLVGAFAQFGLYDARLLLRRYQSLNAILKGAAFWLVAYLGVSLVLKFDPPISRLFVVYAFVCVVALLYAWRVLAYTVVTHSPLLARLRRRAVLLGWSDEARALAAEIARDPAHPFVIAGVVTLSGDTSAFITGALERPPALGPVSDLASILVRDRADLLIATRLDLPRAEIRHIVETCERAYVEWKIVPGAFDIFLSGLRLQTIGRVPVLGVEELAIHRLFNRALKRLCDIVGAAIGLVLSAPVILVLAALIKRESPTGPVFFRQVRVGTGHQTFTLWKLRSMAPGAEATDAERQSTARNDPRLLRIGGFLRRWNLDELPQFWNILRGDMSLVGPRPERPSHVAQLSESIPHYLPRHLVKPGLTGWAQVNALLALLFAFDYQTLVYWLTFTPESAFFVLYLPVALWCLLRARGPGCSWRAGLGLAVLLGFATTIKLTLWPVTLFILAQLALSRASTVSPWRRFVAYTGVAALVFAVAATVLAHDPMALWRWVLGLIEHSGRYGAVRAEGGFFPPWSVGLEALHRAFALQAYTTLPVYAGILLLALWSLRRDPARDPRDRILGMSFFAAFFLLLVMFLKHPYQGKYLMPASLLILLYATAQIEGGPLPALRWIRPLGVVLGLIVLNAVLSQKLLYDFAISRDERVCAHVDAWLARVPHDAVVVSSRLPHPIPAFREMARGPLLPLYFQHFGHIELTGTTSLDFQRVAAPELPALPGVKRAIAFLNTPTPDARWVLVDANPSDALFVYLLK